MSAERTPVQPEAVKSAVPVFGEMVRQLGALYGKRYGQQSSPPFSIYRRLATHVFPNGWAKDVLVDIKRASADIPDDGEAPPDVRGPDLFIPKKSFDDDRQESVPRPDVGQAKTPDAVEEARPAKDAGRTDATFEVIGDLERPEIGAILDRECTIAWGTRKDDKVFRNESETIKDVLHKLLTFEIGRKDGRCLLQGAVGQNGQRRSNNMSANYIMMIDVDTGMDVDTVIEKVKARGLFALVWTTHSHMTTISSVAESALIAFLRKRGEERAPDPSDLTKQVVDYLLEERKYERAVLEDTVFHTTVLDNGLKIQIRHAPMTKCRVLLVLQEPWDFLSGGAQKDRIDEWKKVYANVSDDLGLPYDQSCTDPARLMYTPRKAKADSPGRIVVIAGTALEIAKKYAGAKKSREADIADRFNEGLNNTGTLGKSAGLQTPGLMKFIAKYPDFSIVEWLRSVAPEEARGNSNTDTKMQFTCPREDDHTNPTPEDTAFYVEQKADGTWTASCRHDGCKKESLDDRAWYLDRLCVKYEVKSVDDLTLWSGKARKKQAEEEKEERAKANARDRLPELIEALTPASDNAAIRDVLQAIVKAGVDALDMDGYVKDIAGRTERKRTVLDDVLRTLQREKRCEAKAQSSEVRGGELAQGIAAFNKRFAVIAVGSDVRIARLDRPDVTFLQVHAFKTLTAPERVTVGEKRVAVADRWLTDENRRTYEGVEFKPFGINEVDVDLNEPGQTGSLNLWRGWSVAPRKGDWSKLKRHIFEVVCRRNPYWFAYFMSWLADMIQNPADKPGVAIVLKALKGTGKSTVGDWVARMMPQNSYTISKGDQVLGRFNGHLQGILFTLIEEAFWGGDKAAEAVLKDMITGRTQMVEAKHKDPFQTANHNHIMMCSNSNWVVPATGDERRFFVLEVSDERKGDDAYFRAIYEQMGAGGREAMLYDLSKLKQPGFIDLRKAPVTPWLGDQVQEGLDTVDRWWLSVLESAELILADNKVVELERTGPLSMRIDEAYESYVAHSRLEKGFRTLSKTEFGKRMHALGAVKVRLGERQSTNYETSTTGAKRPYEYRFSDDLDGLRAKFEKAKKIRVRPDVVIEEGVSVEPAAQGEGSEDYSTLVPEGVSVDELAWWRRYGMGEVDVT